MGDALKIEGLDKLLKQLKEFERKDAIKVTRAAVRSGAAVVAKAVKADTPTGDTKALKRAETYKVSNKGLTVTSWIGAEVGKLKDAVHGEQHPSNVDWLTEFGHVAPDGRFVPPTGHMRATAAAAMVEAEAKVAERLATGIEEVLGG